jgi:glutathione S-transferase
MNKDQPLTLIGRSSSHFTRVARIFAAELGVEYSFQIVRDLLSLNPADYGGNPTLKVPMLKLPNGICLGALNICRELARVSSSQLQILWPELLSDLLFANTQELINHAMSTEVNLVMSKVSAGEGGGVHQTKMTQSLVNSLSWLESHVDEVLTALPTDRDVSYLEVTLFCLITHLEFRKVLSTQPYARLNQFADHFATRTSAQTTVYRFDA